MRWALPPPLLLLLLAPSPSAGAAPLPALPDQHRHEHEGRDLRLPGRCDRPAGQTHAGRVALGCRHFGLRLEQYRAAFRRLSRLDLWDEG
eukprot:gene12633-50351_t